MIRTRSTTCGPWLRMLALLPFLAACNTGGSDSDTPPANSAPTSNAGAPQTVFEATTVNLDGSNSSDVNNDTLTFSWTQTAGQAVAINNASTATPDFVAPDVQAGAPEVLTFRLVVSDGTVNNANTNTNTVDITVEENEPPTANAGPDRNVIENTQVTLNATASSDPNSIDTLSFAWNQTGGVAVGLNNPDTAQPTFTAPDVAPGNNEVLTFEVAVSDGVNNDTDSVSITVVEGQTMVTISGKVNYEFVPPNVNCNGLSFVSTVVRPIRGATVQLINSTSGLVIDTTTSDDLGDYSFSGVPAVTDVRLRVRAELKRSGFPSWDVEIRDNTDAASGPLQNRALYAVDGTTFNTGGSDVIRNLTATTGWNLALNSYTDPRAAAPFAILDAIYSGIQLVLSAEPQATFAPLDAYWSVNNTLVSGSPSIDSGELTASFYSSNPDGGAPNPSLFLLGDASVDTEEFDDHVVVHEWGHYFEDNFSRSDSIGGPHAIGQTLDARLAFGEGWATALAGIALDNPQYCDTGAAGTTQGFGINAESDGFGLQGWYNELSVTTFLYDLWDTNVDGTDNSSIGFQPIFETMVGPQATTEAFTSVFSFAAELLPMLNAADQAFVNSQLTRENINPVGIDIWGSTETNDANGNQDALPLYTDMVANGSTTQVCMNADFDGTNRTGNKLAQERYIRLSVPSTAQYNVSVTTVNPPAPTPDPDDRDQSDPDIFIYLDGTLVALGNGADDNSETFTTQSSLLAGETYAVYVEEWRYDDSDPVNGTPDSYPNRICFDVSFTP